MGKGLKTSLVTAVTFLVLLLFSSAGMTEDDVGSIATDQEVSGVMFVYNKEKVQAFLDNYPYLKNKLSSFERVAKNHNIDVVLMIAIILQETGGSSQALIEHNNPSGQMIGSTILHFDTLDEGLEMTGRTLNNLINERGLNTIESLGSAYAPVGASNDPMGMNAQWVPSVKKFVELLGGTLIIELSGPDAAVSGVVGKDMLSWGNSLYKKGVIYSMDSNRGTFPYYDCSAFVTLAMKHAGVPVGLGSTETLYQLEGQYLIPIEKSQVKAGDIFVWGVKGGSGGEFGHTGIFLDNGQNIIHCTPATERGFGQEGDIVKTPFENYYGSPVAPVYFYRVKK